MSPRQLDYRAWGMETAGENTVYDIEAVVFWGNFHNNHAHQRNGNEEAGSQRKGG